jgi:hypothetical protein
MIALLNTRGFLTEYASILSEQASNKGCNTAILTDFASGLLIASNIPNVYRIGIDFHTLDYLDLDPDEVEEKYKPKQNHLKPQSHLPLMKIWSNMFQIGVSKLTMSWLPLMITPNFENSYSQS